MSAGVRTVTFLLTDIEGSTSRWERAPQEMSSLLVRHDDLLRRAVEHRGGTRVKSTGDGILAVFDVPSAAVRAAVDAQLALREQQLGGDDALLVRMGVHTGEGEPRDGDYYGAAVNLAARLCNVAHGGQVLVSAATAAMLGPDPEVTLTDAGEVRLRGIHEAVHAFQVMHARLPAAFPPLEVARTVPGLPIPSGHMIGRTQELRDVATAIADHRLVTVVGPSGVGKTRLAVAAAEHLTTLGSAEVVWCDLALLSAGGDAATVVVDALGAPRRDDPVTAAVDALADRRVVVICDNVEHVVDSVRAMVKALLARCPNTRVLCTSQVPVGLPGERVLPLPTLDVDGDAPAVELFMERAAASGAVADRSIPAMASVAELCRRLDGLPLALELAAARSRSVPATEILRRLDSRLRLLRNDRTAADDRHHSLATAVTWSYDLLGTRARAVFEALAVFADSFTAEAAHAVCGATDDELDTIDELAGLVDRSLLTVIDTASGPRYRMLESLRAFGRERLNVTAAAPLVRERWSGWYRQLTARVAKAPLGPDERALVRQMQSEFANVRAVHEWAVQNGRADVALGVVVDLFWFAHHGQRYELLDWALDALAIPGADSSPLAAPTHGVAAYFAGLTGRPSVAEQHVARGLQLDPRCWLVVNASATVAYHRGRADEALALYRRSLELALNQGRRFEELTSTVQLAMIHLFPLRLEGIDELAEHAEHLAQQLGSPTALAQASWARGFAHYRSEPAQAVECFERAIILARAVDSVLVVNSAVDPANRLRAKLSHLTPAARLQMAAARLPMWRDGGSGFWRAIREISWSLSDLGFHQEAAQLFGAERAAPLKFPTDATETSRLERAVAVTRNVLGEAAYATAAAQGATMDRDQLAGLVGELVERIADRGAVVTDGR